MNFKLLIARLKSIKLSLNSKELNKYENLTDEEAKLAQSPLGQIFKKRLNNIESKNNEKLKEIEDQRGRDNYI